MSRSPDHPAPFDETDELNAVIDHGVVSVYQPIVELTTGATVAYEALARGPEGSPLQMPGALFGAAARHGRLVDLDWACRAAAMRGAIGTALEKPTALFVNIEPVASMARIPDQFAATVEDAKSNLQVVFELTERALTERPAEVLRAVRVLRNLGAMIALDDVGVDPRSLALMPFLSPDVIKLDMTLVQGAPSMHMARVMHAVNAEAQRSGAVVLAEGIENAEHLERANALGATHGQGWLFGRPGPAPTHRVVDATFERPRAGKADSHARTPFGVVDEGATKTPRIASKRLLLALSQQLEFQAQDLGPECVVLSNLQERKHLTERTLDRYDRLAERAAFVGILGEGVGAQPSANVRGGELTPDDPLRAEWNVVVVSPHFGAAMVARDLGDDGDDMQRRFEYHLTYDRAETVQTAKLMMDRVAATA